MHGEVFVGEVELYEDAVENIVWREITCADSVNAQQISAPVRTHLFRS